MKIDFSVSFPLLAGMNFIPIDNGNRQSAFSVVPAASKLFFQGKRDPGIQVFFVESEAGNYYLPVASAISREEAFIWKAFEELLKRSLQEAAAGMKGFYGFELLNLDFGPSLRHFEWNSFKQLMINHSVRMQPGESRIIPFSGLLALFKKRIPEEWGKIEVSSAVKVYNREPEKIDLYFRALVQACDGLDQPFEIVCQDLGSQPLLNFQNAEVCARMKNWIAKQKNAAPGLKRFFYLQGNQKAEDLLVYPWEK